MDASTVLRVARPTDHLERLVAMYCAGLGFRVLGAFEDHDGFDGAMIGLASHSYHLEFTHHRGHTAGRAPTRDNLLVFYEADEARWRARCDAMERAGFLPVRSYNPYWDRMGRTFEDVDGYRVVIQRDTWAL
jgi:catechol 2,3-dioxygenase-like lactoylglutathione lyase family enzyme